MLTQLDQLMRGAQRRRLLLLVASFVAGSPTSAKVILDANFNGGTNPWPNYYQQGSSNVTRVRAIAPVGTIDAYNGAPSNALRLVVDAAGATGSWWSAVRSSSLSGANAEANVSRLTLSFDLWTNRQHPVYVQLFSGGAFKEFIAYPAVAGSYKRYSFDLDQANYTSPNFNPVSGSFELVFGIRNTDPKSPWPAVNGNEIRVDNVSFTSPTFYVSSSIGSPTNTGATPTAGSNGPLDTIQRAVNLAQPGDVICVMNGTYAPANSYSPAVKISKAGLPSRWIVIRNSPGHTPTIQHQYWAGIEFSSEAAYVELRGLTVRGNAAAIAALTNPSGLSRAQEDGAKQYRTDDEGQILYGDDGKPLLYYGNPIYNGTGISIDSRFTATRTTAGVSARAHHLRIVDNVVYENSGAGIVAIEADYITIENNEVFSNCWFMRNAGSGISVFHSAKFDPGTGYKYYVIGNRVYDNECFVKWARFLVDNQGDPIPDVISDGNGIIVDDFRNTQSSVTVPLRNVINPGRVLVQNNLSYENGGAGIQSFRSDRVTITNNTTYLNSRSPALDYGEVRIEQTANVSVANNIMWGRLNENIQQVGNSTGAVFQNNVYTGDGNHPGITNWGPGSIWVSNADKVNLFVNLAARDFSLKAGSKAIDAGSATATGTPLLDLRNALRPNGTGVDAGAYEY